MYTLLVLLLAPYVGGVVYSNEAAASLRVSRGECCGAYQCNSTCPSAPGSVYGSILVSVVRAPPVTNASTVVSLCNETARVSGVGVNITVASPIGPANMAMVRTGGNGTHIDALFVFDCRSLTSTEHPSFMVHITCTASAASIDVSNPTKKGTAHQLEVKVFGECVQAYLVRMRIYDKCACNYSMGSISENSTLRVGDISAYYGTTGPCTEETVISVIEAPQTTLPPVELDKYSETETPSKAVVVVPAAARVMLAVTTCSLLCSAI